MIKSERGEVLISGSIGDIRADLTVLIKSVRDAFLEEGVSKEHADEIINDCVRYSSMSISEIKKDIVKNILDDLFGGVADAD